MVFILKICFLQLLAIYTAKLRWPFDQQGSMRASQPWSDAVATIGRC